MSKRILMCVDTTTGKNPELMGLGGETVDAQTWLHLATDGDEARRLAQEDSLSESWVVSCDDVEPINLAATLKEDVPQLHVCLITTELCGSLLSRAYTAGIDEVIDVSNFLARYAKEKAAHGLSVRTHAHAKTSVAERGPKQVYRTESKRAILSESANQAERTVLSEGAAQAENAAVSEGTAVSESTALPEALLRKSPERHQLKRSAMSGKAFVLSVVSGSGGAGKSAVATLAALLAHQAGHHTLLLDCDLQFGEVASFVNAHDALCVDEVIQYPEKLEHLLSSSEGLTVLAAPKRLEVAEEIVDELPELLEKLIAHFDFIAINTGSSWGEQHAVLLERSSAVLFLVDQRVSSVHASQHAFDLCERCGIATGPFQFALNRCAKGAPLTSMDVSSAFQGAPVYELKDGGREVEDYLSAGSAAELIEIRNEFARSIEHVLEKMMPSSSTTTTSKPDDIESRRILRRRNRYTGKKRRR